jgi:hypothetical protein
MRRFVLKGNLNCWLMRFVLKANASSPRFSPGAASKKGKRIQILRYY